MYKRKINIHLECGEKGVGKTTFVKEKWKQHLLITCGSPLNEIKTTGALFFSLNNIYNEVTDDLADIVKYLCKAIQDDFVIIIDEAENINKELLEIIVNCTLLYQNSTTVFTFDLNCENIYKSEIFRLLIDWDIIPSNKPMKNFCTSLEQFNSFIENKQPAMPVSMKNELIVASNYNFSNLNRLLWLIINKQTKFDRISEVVIAEYSYFLVEEKLSGLPADLFNILKQSCIIGEIFQSCILESPDGFQVLGVKAYLDKLEATNLFIQSYLQDDIYHFITRNIYTGVLKTIEPHEKVESQRILLRYYMIKLASERESDKILEYLRQLKRVSYDLNDYEMMVFSDKKLLFRYLKIGDITKAREVLNDLLVFCKNNDDDNLLYLFLSYYKIRLDMSIGKYDDVLKCITTVQKNLPNDSNLYLQYYYAKSLYGIGDVDASYLEVSNLSAMLKSTSSKATNDQPIYALTYSLLATIQNHFGIEDFGNRYYNLALEHSKHKLKDKAIHFEILKKCDMYFEFEQSYPLMLQSISYFESVDRVYDAAQVYVNLATEMLFNEGSNVLLAEQFFEKSIRIFSNIPNENLAYAQNNLAILKIIQYGNFQSALALLEDSLIVGMSAFTYMTLYLNICMCYLVIYNHENSEFKHAYNEFCKYHSMIKIRDNPTQYEDLYKGLLDITVLEHKGHSYEVIMLVDKFLSLSPSQFFIPILEDIKARNTRNSKVIREYSDNKVLYATFKKYKLFFAEFRFWE